MHQRTSTKRLHVLTFAALLTACGGAGEPSTSASTVTSGGDGAPTGPATPATEEEADRFATANDAFAADLWQRLRERDGNLAVSPASISVALAMTWGGARGDTARAMADVMHFGDDPAAFHRAASGTLAVWNDPDRTEYELAVANRLFAEQTYSWQPSFVALTRDRYAAPLEPVDFRGAAESARQDINAWVEDRTRDRIADLIPSGALDADTRMVLANAIYFRADWQAQFVANDTSDQAFHAPNGAVQVPTMHQTHRFAYGATDGVQLLEMPYRGGELSMLIALPEERGGLSAIEAQLGADTVDRWVDALSVRDVAVSLPKFRVDPAEPIALRDTLSAMGMAIAFDGSTADFSGMADPDANEGRPLFIDDVFHKAFVAVDEEGTEAAAATAVVMSLESAAMPPQDLVRFTADHPFLFFIRDTRSGAILFMGRVADPSGN